MRCLLLLILVLASSSLVQGIFSDPDECDGRYFHKYIYRYKNRCIVYDTKAICVDGYDGYTCDCSPEWQGEFCDEDVDECALGICQNNAVCTNYIVGGLIVPGGTMPNILQSLSNAANVVALSEVGFKCDCIFGTEGIDCSINPDDCAIHPFVRNGITYPNECIVMDKQANCTDGFGTYTCQCTDQWKGEHCQEDVDECTTLVPYPCFNFGTCFNTPGSFFCKCHKGTYGEFCEFNPDDCANVTVCNATDTKGICLDGFDEYFCVCGPDYTGRHCDLEMVIYKVLELIGGDDNTDETILVQMMRDLLNNPSMMKDLVPFIIGLQSEDERTARSWEASDIFLWATYEEKKLDLSVDLYKWNDVVLGNCFTFNHLNNSRKYLTRSDGAQGGMRVALKLHAEEYVPWVETTAIMIFTHPQTETIFSESPRYNAEPGGETSIQVIETRYQRLGGRYGVCVTSSSEVASYYYTGSYTTEGCLRSCYQDQVQKECLCMDSRYPMADGASACQLPQRQCVDRIVAKGDVSKWAGCDCPLPCSNSEFTGSWTRAPFVHSKGKCYTLSKSERANSTECSNGDTPDYATVAVRIPSIRVNIYVETPVWNFNRFISTLGGLGAVVCGISIMTVFDFVFLLGKLFGDLR